MALRGTRGPARGSPSTRLGAEAWTRTTGTSPRLRQARKGREGTQVKARGVAPACLVSTCPPPRATCRRTELLATEARGPGRLSGGFCQWLWRHALRHNWLAATLPSAPPAQQKTPLHAVPFRLGHLGRGLPGGHSDWRGARREARGLRPGPHGTCVLDNGASAFGSSGWTAGRALSPTRPGQHRADSRPQAFPGMRRGTQHAVHAVGLRRRGAAREAARPSAPLADGPVRAPLLGELRAGGKRCLLTGELNNGPLFQAPARSLGAHLHGG